MLFTDLSILLVSCLYAVISVAGSNSVATLNLDSEEPQRRRCKFSLDSQFFNLCPLLEKENAVWGIESKKETPPTITRTVYQFSFKGKLPAEDNLDEDEQCPDGVWACMHTYNYNPHHKGEKERILQTIPIAGVIPSQSENHYPGVNITAKLSPSREDKAHDVLHVRLHGGWYVNQPQELDIQMFCDHKAEEPTQPSYYYNWNGTHAFRWNTKHACGTKIVPTITGTREATPVPSPTDEPEPEQDKEVPPDEADDSEDGAELLDPALGGHSRRSAWMILLSSTSIVALAIYILYYPPRPIRRRLASFLKSHPSLLRFRVGENVLVRWAEEDMNLDDMEDDVMVNGERDPLFVVDDEEQIPLKPSPRKGHVYTMSYGSAM